VLRRFDWRDSGLVDWLLGWRTHVGMKTGHAGDENGNRTTETTRPSQGKGSGPREENWPRKCFGFSKSFSISGFNPRFKSILNSIKF
jgi:hypothetical protein